MYCVLHILCWQVGFVGGISSGKCLTASMWGCGIFPHQSAFGDETVGHLLFHDLNYWQLVI